MYGKVSQCRIPESGQRMRVYWYSFSLILISLLVACGRQGDPVAMPNVESVEMQAAETPTSSPTPTPTMTATHTSTPNPTHTPTPPPTNTVTPSPTNSPVPTNTPTSTPTPTTTPTPTPTATATTASTPTLLPPTPLPTSTPTPSVDFRLASWRLWPLELNSGCDKGMHNIFIIVLDANGAPLDGVVVGDTWNNVEEISGRKGPGRTEINLWANAMEITVKRDAATEQLYTSEASPPSGSFMTDIPTEQLVQAGYCANDVHCEWMKENDGFRCGGHFSWEIIFQRTY